MRLPEALEVLIDDYSKPDDFDRLDMSAVTRIWALETAARLARLDVLRIARPQGYYPQNTLN